MSSLRDILPAPRNAGPATEGDEYGRDESSPRVAPASTVVAAPASRGAGVTALLPLSVNADGEADFSAIARAGENATRVVHADHSAMVEKPRDAKLQTQLVRPDADAMAETARRTREALEPIVRGKVSASLPANFRGREGGAHQTAEFVRYTPASTNLSGPSKQRVIKMVQAPVDPMEPPRFARKKTPHAPPSPPVPVLHSPERKLTKEEAADWVVPPAISNWKNNRGYTVPLDKRLASDATGLRDTTINDRFASFAEAMYMAERKAREEVEERAVIQRNVSLKAKEAKEKQLRDLAARAREERAGFMSSRADSEGGSHAGAGGAFAGAVVVDDEPPPRAAAGSASGAPSSDRSPRRRPRVHSVDDNGLDDVSPDGDDVPADDVARRDAIRAETRRRREREMRLRATHDDDGEQDGPTLKRSKLSRDEDRDVAERVALGQAPAEGGGTAKEVAYDQRLFNQGSQARGMAAGFGGQDADTLYDKPLFEQGGSGKFQYRPQAAAGGGGGGAGGLGEAEGGGGGGTARFRPQRALGGGGADGGPRTKPVEFEHDAAAAADGGAAGGADDPFGLNSMLGKMTRAKK